jgi:P-type Cu+ transporter
MADGTGTPTIELPIQGVDCASCVQTVERALAGVPGVEDVRVLLASERAIVRGETSALDPAALRRAVEKAGYRVGAAPSQVGGHLIQIGRVAPPPPAAETLELPIDGMDCASCAQTVQAELARVPGVDDAQVLLGSEKAIVRGAAGALDGAALRRAVEKAGYRVGEAPIPAGTQPIQIGRVPPRAPAAETLELRIEGMDCASCAQTVQAELAKVPGVDDVQVLLATEKAIVRGRPGALDRAALRQAVGKAGYRAGDMLDAAPAAEVSETGEESQTGAPAARRMAWQVLGLFGMVFGAVLLVVVAGEWLGLFRSLTELVPFPVGVALVVVAGFPVFRDVVRGALHRRVISHTLMTLGVIAALAVGQWPTAVVVVFFMRVGDLAESFTTERGRRAIRGLAQLAPATARVERAEAGGASEITVPAAEVSVGEIVVVRPGERIPVDGVVLSGEATIDQAAITGESMPVDAGPGAPVYAATTAQLGALRVRTTAAGRESTYGRVIRLVEEAEAHRADVQRVADRFSAWFLPIVATIAALTFAVSRNPLATASVLVVACSCSLALATPIAMLASVGAAARRGLLVKGGRYLETLARADMLLFDKTGTLTAGRPRITEIVALGGRTEEDVLSLAAAAERYSEHPLAEAVRRAAAERGVDVPEPDRFEARPGEGVRADVAGAEVSVGRALPADLDDTGEVVERLEACGTTTLVVRCSGRPVGVLGAQDAIRPETDGVVEDLRRLGLDRIEILTGDNERVATALGRRLGVNARAGLLSADKAEVVREHQRSGRIVVMVGDGINDAPALAQADVGIAMGGAGTAVASEAAHIALLRDDLTLVPQALRVARRTMRTVRFNLGFTAVYNVVGLSLAAFGILPPILAAAAQSLPDLGILANSSRLLRQR